MSRENRLGLGLDAIFGKQVGHKIEHVLLNDIRISDWQPRQNFAQEQLMELAESIKTYGVLQPILLRRLEDATFELVAGERRYRASKIAQKETIPAVILDANLQSILEISVVENLQRVDLNPIEKAEAFAFLIEKFGISHAELAQRLNINRSVISNYLRLNTLSAEVKNRIASGQLSFGHAKAIANRADADKLATEIVEKKLSVREVEKKISKAELTEIKRFEEIITTSIGMETKINLKKSGGELIINFADLNQLEEIMTKLCD